MAVSEWSQIRDTVMSTTTANKNYPSKGLFVAMLLKIGIIISGRTCINREDRRIREA